jgi:transposase
VARFILEVFVLEIIRAMELLTILNHCHHHRGFVYRQDRFTPDKKILEVVVRPREGSAAICSGCHQPALGYDRLGKERTIESFQGFFTLIGEQLASQIEFVCSDMWQPYLDVICQKCSQAWHLLDRFHIVAKMNKALHEVRAAESRKMAQEGHEPLLKKSRWCVLKRKENLTDKQQHRLRNLLRYNLRTVRAYLLKEDFQQFWDYHSPTWAGMFLDFWCYQTMRSRIEPMKKIAPTLRAHQALLLNYFKARKEISSGVVEGLNHKAKVTMRRSYGFRTFRILELALYHSLGKLPEPELTHEFF